MDSNLRSVSLQICCVAVCIVLLLISTLPVSAELTTAIGGQGGGPFSADCGQYGVLVGLTGRSGARIDQIAGLCAVIDPISELWIGDPFPTNHFGGNGGGPFTMVCTRNQALVGISGQTADVIANLRIICADLQSSDDGNSVVAGRNALSAGSAGQDLGNRVASNRGMCHELTKQGSPKATQTPGGTSFQYPAPDVVGYWIARSLVGRSGALVDQIQLSCDAVARPMKNYLVKAALKPAALVPEGTPVVISSQASGLNPQITPPLHYSWELLDQSHQACPAPGQFGFCQPSRVSHGAAPNGAVTFHDLPPAAYRVDLEADAPSGYGQGKASVYFEVVPNLLVSLTMSPESVQAGAPATGTVTMEGPAPTKGRILYLFTSNPSLVPVPASFTVPGGSATGMFTLHPNSAPGSAGQVTISVSTNPPLSAKLSTSVQGVLSRGLDEPGQPESGSEAPPPTETTDTAGQVTERGLTSLQLAKPSTSVQSATKPPAATAPSATLPAGQLGAAATQVTPGSQAGSLSPEKLKMNLPGDTKSAVISVRLPYGTQLPGSR